MWLPKLIYESIPLYFLGLGFAALVAAFYIEEWHWAEISAGGGIVLLIIGLMLVFRRKGYRASRSRLDFDNSN